MTRRLLPQSGAFSFDIPEHYNIAERCCDSWAAEAPERIALIHAGTDGDTRWSYGALKDASDRLAEGLRTRDVAAGDRVGIYLSQSPEMMISLLAVWKLGAIALPLFTLFGPDALTFRLRDSGAKVLIAEGRIDLEWDELPDLTHCIAVEDGFGVETIGALIAASPPVSAVKTKAEAPAMMIYTSGTTGPPKGVLHAHRFLIGHLPCMETTHAALPLPDDVGWTPADWAWIGGLMDLAIPCLYYGVPVVSHRMRKFDADAAWALIARLGITRMFLPPTALRLMRQAPVPGGVHVRSIGSGGESLGADLLDWGRNVLGAEINELYGQTECNLVVASNAAAGVQRAGKLGRAVPGHDVAVLGPDGPVTDEIGEIAVRRPDPVMFLRYWNQPEKTRDKFRGEWLLTGDLGQIDRDGYIASIGRNDDVISSAGYRIGPTEIEACLMRHPQVALAAVVGVPDETRTQSVVAFVVPVGSPGPDLAEALIAKVRAELSPHMAPREVRFRDELPMTATGKVMRRVLRAQ